MFKKLLYKLKVLNHPESWGRVHNIHQAWDEELWDKIQSVNNIRHIGKHYALIDKHCVWIANYPYASGSIELFEKTCYCSRSTALFLSEQLDKARVLLTLKGITLEDSERAIREVKYKF